MSPSHKGGTCMALTDNRQVARIGFRIVGPLMMIVTAGFLVFGGVILGFALDKEAPHFTTRLFEKYPWCFDGYPDQIFSPRDCLARFIQAEAHRGADYWDQRRLQDEADLLAMDEEERAAVLEARWSAYRLWKDTDGL